MERKLAYKPRLGPSERREKIERAAAELFAARGYEASSLDEIARAAGITKRVIYRHFSSKRDLQIALLHKRTDELLDLVGRETAVEAPAGLRLEAGVTAFFRYMEEHPDAWRMLFRDPPADREIAAAHRAVQARATEAIAAILATGLSPGVTAPPEWPALMAQQLKSALNGLADWWYEHREVPRARIVAAAMDFGWEGLRRHTAEDGHPAADDTASASAGDTP